MRLVSTTLSARIATLEALAKHVHVPITLHILHTGSMPACLYILDQRTIAIHPQANILPCYIAVLIDEGLDNLGCMSVARVLLGNECQGIQALLDIRPLQSQAVSELDRQIAAAQRELAAEDDMVSPAPSCDE